MASSYADSTEHEPEEQQIQAITSNGRTSSPSLQETQHCSVQNGTQEKPKSLSDSSAATPRLPCTGRRPRNPAVLILWIEEHAHNPYPSKSEKTMLAHYAGMTQRQLNDWFANARRNIKKVGYAVWKEKHPAYSACFSLGHVIRQNSLQPKSEGRTSISTAPVTVKMPTFSAEDAATTSHSIPAVTNSLNYGIKEEVPASMVPIQSYPRTTTTLNHHRPFPSYFIPPQSSLVNVAGAHQPAGVGTLQSVTMNPAAATAYYKVQQPQLASINFQTLGQPNMALYTANRQNCVLQPPFNCTSTLSEISSPWPSCSTTLASTSNTCETSLASELPAAETRGGPRPLTSPLPEQDTGVESNSSQNETISASQNVNVVTPETTWDANLPISSASHQQLYDFSIATSQQNEQEMAPTNQWSANALYQQVQSYHH